MNFLITANLIITTVLIYFYLLDSDPFIGALCLFNAGVFFILLVDKDRS